MDFWFIAKIIAFGSLIIACSITLAILNKVEAQDNCKCAHSWKSKLLAIICYVILIMAVINIFISVNSMISKIPLIGGIYAFMILLVIGLFLGLMISVFNDIEKCDGCEISGFSAKFMHFLIGFSTTICVGLILGFAYASIAL